MSPKLFTQKHFLIFVLLVVLAGVTACAPQAAAPAAPAEREQSAAEVPQGEEAKQQMPAEKPAEAPKAEATAAPAADQAQCRQPGV